MTEGSDPDKLQRRNIKTKEPLWGEQRADVENESPGTFQLMSAFDRRLRDYSAVNIQLLRLKRRNFVGVQLTLERTPCDRRSPKSRRSRWLYSLGEKFADICAIH